jgi:NarL family two-component system sensor histidine kinase LiaS
MAKTSGSETQAAVPFRQLQWKLTLSYAAVTIGTLFLAVIIGAVLLLRTVFAPENIIGADEWIQITQERVAPVMRPILSMNPVDTDIVEATVKDISGTVTSRDFLRLSDTQLSVRTTGEVDIIVVGPDGALLGASNYGILPEVTPGQLFDPGLVEGLQDPLEAALDGETNPGRLFLELDPDEKFLYVMPVFDGDDPASEILGTVVFIIESAPTQRDIPAYIMNVVSRSAVVFVIGAAILATVFGALTAGGIIKRLSRLSAATDNWSKGDFSSLVEDQAGDELSILTGRMNIMAVQLQDLLDRRQEMAVAGERNRLARELHDSAKQQAFGASAQLAAAEVLWEQNPEEAKAHVLEAEKMIDQVRSELGNLILELRPVELTAAGLPDALRQYADNWANQNDIEVDVQTAGEEPLMPEVERTLLRITQEALANVARHSGAERVHIRLQSERDMVSLMIGDDGVGFNTEKPDPGLGLLSMSERSQLIGGQISIESAQGQGTQILVTCPAGAQD